MSRRFEVLLQNWSETIHSYQSATASSANEAGADTTDYQAADSNDMLHNHATTSLHAIPANRSMYTRSQQQTELLVVLQLEP